VTRIPTVETERLRLVAPEPRHLPGEEAFWPTERAKFLGGPVPAHRVWRILALWRGHWDLRGYGSWALEDKRTGAHLGLAGIWHPGEWPEPEIGYHLFDGAEGRGFATEAVRAVLGYAYGTLGWTTLTSFIDPANTASQRVALRLGARRSGATFRANPDDPEVDIWRYPGPEGVA